MSGSVQIQLGNSKFVDSVNSDGFVSTNLSTPSVEILPYDETSTINVAQLFNDERQASEIYRFYGSINFMSLVNGLKLNYKEVDDFFKRPAIGIEMSGLTRNILNTFDVYLCRPLGNKFDGNTVIQSGNTKVNSTIYQLKYEVLSNINNFEIYKSGFAKNIYFDQVYSYHFSIDADLLGQTDSFNKPITKMYLYFKFRPSTNKNGVVETISRNIYASNNPVNRVPVPYEVHEPGDIIGGDWVYYIPTNFDEIEMKKLEYYVKFVCSGSSGTGLSFKYQPFFEINVREYGDEIISGNISGTSEIDREIPYYAVKIDNHGNYIWKDILQNGYIDPITNKGVNFPFVNKRHYIFNNIVLKLTTDLLDTNTSTVFSTIKFGPNSLRFVKPLSDLNNLGERC